MLLYMLIGWHAGEASLTLIRGRHQTLQKWSSLECPRVLSVDAYGQKGNQRKTMPHRVDAIYPSAWMVWKSRF